MTNTASGDDHRLHVSVDRQTANVAALLIGVSTLIAPVISGVLPRAWATCAGAETHEAVGGYENNSNRLGNRVSVLVNTFSSDQFDSWRSITVWRNGNYSAEVGWYVDEDVD